MKFFEHVYRKVGFNRGCRRVWLQGLRLSAAGFEKGLKYRVDWDFENGSICLVLDENGDRVVVSKKKNKKSDELVPVIDICNSDVLDVTKGEEKVRVDFAIGYIKVSIHHHASKQAERENRLKANLFNGSLKEGSLCTGGGVAALAVKAGLSDQNIQSSLEWVVDRERKYLKVANDNNLAITEDTVLFEGALEEIEPELLSPVDLLQFSLSCCPSSKQGKAKNKLVLAEQHKDAIGLFGFIKILEAVNPSILLSENVVTAKTSATYLLLKNMLEVLGYVIHEIDLDGEQAGTIENRKRYWFVAVSSGLPQVDLRNIPSYQREYESLGEALEYVPEDDPSWSDNKGLKVKAQRDQLDGKNFKRQLVTEETRSITCIGRGYARRRSTEAFLVRDDQKERLLTPIEHARVKGAPEELIDNVPPTTAHEILGQSILFGNCRGLASLIADSIFKLLLDPKHLPKESPNNKYFQREQMLLF